MRTLMILAGGFVLLAVCLFGARFASAGGGSAMALGAKIFIPLWLLVAAYNMYVGVSQAGYSVAEELPIFLLIFVVPAVVAAIVWWRAA